MEIRVSRLRGGRFAPPEQRLVIGSCREHARTRQCDVRFGIARKVHVRIGTRCVGQVGIVCQHARIVVIADRRRVPRAAIRQKLDPSDIDST